MHLSVQAVRCTRFLDRENLAAYRARLRFNERAAAELLEQASALMAQAKSCHVSWRPITVQRWIWQSG